MTAKFSKEPDIYGKMTRRHGLTNLNTFLRSKLMLRTTLGKHCQIIFLTSVTTGETAQYKKKFLISKCCFARFYLCIPRIWTNKSLIDQYGELKNYEIQMQILKRKPPISCFIKFVSKIHKHVYFDN